MRVVGLDGYARGWLAVALRDRRLERVWGVRRIEDLLPVDAACIGVDIPIGIPEREPRAADVAAREFVGARRSSVFLTFPRPVLEAGSYSEAAERARTLGWPGLSRQSYNLASRILEADDVSRQDDRIIEVHPEVSFRELARSPLLHSKHSWSGAMMRRRLLATARIDIPDEIAVDAPVADVLDAAVAAWSAGRYARGEALPLPEGHAARIGAIWR